MAGAEDEQMHDASDVPWDASNGPWRGDGGVPDFDRLYGVTRGGGRYPAPHPTTPSGAQAWQDWSPSTGHTGTQHSGVPSSWEPVTGTGQNYPTFTDGQQTWERKEEADRPPEWDSNNPLEQVEVYINAVKFWQKFTASKKEAQGKLLFDKMRGKLKSVMLDMVEEDDDGNFPLAKENAIEEMLNRIKYTWHDYLTNPLPKAGSNLVYSKDRYKKSEENYRTYIHRL